MISKIREIIQENRDYHTQNQKILQDIRWGMVYHDSIRGKHWLENLSLNIGRWAGGYNFFYVLNRILADYKPQRILEMGLGESTKFIIAYENHIQKLDKHVILEHDSQWFLKFKESIGVKNKSEFILSPLREQTFNGKSYNGYTDIQRLKNEKFDLYIVDGPIGTAEYSRFDIVTLLNGLDVDDEFVLMFDDYHRAGEKQTMHELRMLMDLKKIIYYESVYTGSKDLLIITTKKYKNITSL
jgi:hypothetical protein